MITGKIILKKKDFNWNVFKFDNKLKPVWLYQLLTRKINQFAFFIWIVLTVNSAVMRLHTGAENLSDAPRWSTSVVTHSLSATLMWAVPGRNAPTWPWQQVTGITSTLTPIPPSLRYGCNIWDVVHVGAWRNPFLLHVQVRFLKDSTSKMRHMEMTHTRVPRVQTLQLKCWQVQNRIRAVQVCVYYRWQNTWRQ